MAVVNSTLPTPVVRRGARAVSVAASTTLLVTGVVVAGPASASVPEGWSDPAPVDALEALGLLVGIPLLLFVLIALAVYAPALARGEKVTPGEREPDREWIGGPREGIEAADRVAAAQLEGKDTGGASGRW